MPQTRQLPSFIGQLPRGAGKRTRRFGWRARQGSGVVVALTLLVAAACATDGAGPERAADPRPVTVAESELLAQLRLRNHDAGSRAITATYSHQGHDVRLEGWFDYSTYTGYALVSSDGLPTDRVTWNGTIVATTDGTWLGTPLTSLKGWRAGELDPRNSPLAVVLSVLARLGSDRPENPQLIRQGGALWLREDTTGGRPVTVFTGPTAPPAERAHRDAARKDRPDGGAAEGAAEPGAGAAATARDTHPAETAAGPRPLVDPEAAGLRYWVDGRGVAHRVDVRLGTTWAEIVLENDDVRVPPLLAGVEPEEAGGTGG